MIDSISAVRTTSVTPNINQIISSSRTTVPVKPLYSIYARFKHFVGIPSKDSSVQVPVTKLRILDNLIERIVKLRGKDSNMSPEKINTSDIDPMIQSLEQELRNSLISQKPSFTGLYPETGILFNTFA
jgi:hypothetical protein